MTSWSKYFQIATKCSDCCLICDISLLFPHLMCDMAPLHNFFSAFSYFNCYQRNAEDFPWTVTVVHLSQKNSEYSFPATYLWSVPASGHWLDLEFSLQMPWGSVEDALFSPPFLFSVHFWAETVSWIKMWSVLFCRQIVAFTKFPCFCQRFMCRLCCILGKSALPPSLHVIV